MWRYYNLGHRSLMQRASLPARVSMMMCITGDERADTDTDADAEGVVDVIDVLNHVHEYNKATGP